MPLRGWAMVIFRDHRDHKIEEQLDRLRKLQVPGLPSTDKTTVAINQITRIRQIVGIRPYHVLLELQAPAKETRPAQDQLKAAFDYLEANFSHVDGFWG